MRYNLTDKARKIEKELHIYNWFRVPNTGDAGYDLRVANVAIQSGNAHGTTLTIDTGVMLEIPHGYAGVLKERSSVALSTPLILRAGLIDSTYRGEIKIIMTLKGNYHLESLIGRKIAQLVIVPYYHTDLLLSDSLSQTERGTSGFGSTGER